MIAATYSPPAYDPESKDAPILEAFETVRSGRARVYSFDALSNEERSAVEPAIAEIERQSDLAEVGLRDLSAETIPGVIARLMLAIPSAENARWVDRGLMAQGLLALHRVEDHLPIDAQQLVRAAVDLVAIEWEQNLATYERSRADFDLVLNLKAIVEAEQVAPRGGTEDPYPFLRAIADMVDRLEDRFSNQRAIDALVRTLVPDHPAYLRKVNIIIAEGYQEDASPWLARDTNYLVGCIEDAEPQSGESR